MILSVLLRTSRSFLLLALIQAILALTADCAFSQNILKLYGQVIDDNGPVYNASVIIENMNLKTYTDQEGFFYFYDIPPGDYRLVCRFKSIEVYTNDKIAVDSGSPLRRDIFLKSGILNVVPIQVESSKTLPSEHSGYLVKVYDLDPKTNESINDIINNIPGLNFITSPATGEINISANGIRPEGINILIDGHRLNSLLTGRADLSQLPLKAISRIEYYTPGATAMAFEGGLGGTVNFITNINPRTGFIEASLANGSFNSEDYSVNMAFSKPVLGQLNSLWEKGFVRNDYDYTDNFNEIKTRENSFISYDKYYLSYFKNIMGYYLNLSGFIYEGKNGVPGQIITPSLNAVSDKKTVSTGMDLTRNLGQKGSISVLMSYQDRNTHYKDYGNWIPYDTKFYERKLDMATGIEFYGFKWLNLSSRISYANDLLNGMDYIRPLSALDRLTRRVYAIQNGVGFNQVVNRLTLSSGLSYSYSRVDKKDYTGASLSAAIVYKRGFSLGWRSAYGKSFRLPGLAELHWQEDVFVIANPDLKPERSRSLTSEIFCEYALLGAWRLSLEYRDVRYKDLIYWQRSQGLKFKPVNVAKSDLFSTTAVVAYSFPNDLVKINFSRVRSVPLNREKDPLFYGKYITHQPLYINRLEISLNYHDHYFSAEMYDSGERYTLKENTKRLDPYTLVNLKAGIQTQISTVKAIWEFKILNLTDKDYELLEYQPMPPRNYHISLTIKI